MVSKSAYRIAGDLALRRSGPEYMVGSDDPDRNKQNLVSFQCSTDI
jgi:hypothetical protein